jgi:hypothetical protein
MPFHTIAYSESQDSATLVNIAALADTSGTVAGDDVLVPEGFGNIAGVYFAGANFTRGQLDSPSLRRTGLLDVEPGDNSAEPSVPTPWMDLFETPIPVQEGEVLRALAAEDAAGAARTTAIIWLSDGPIAPVTGDIRTFRATGTATLVANAWSPVTLTLDQVLGVGTYQLVGARCTCAGGVAFRFIAQREGFRPGAIAFDADGDVDVDRFRRGRAGVWFDFTQRTLPQIEVLSVSADTAETVFLDLIGPA